VSIALLASLILVQPALAEVGRGEEIRCCVPVERDRYNEITRSESVKRAFRKRWPCPVAPDDINAPCTGWSIDHVIPRACGGRDIVSNMQWLNNQIKSAAGVFAKDRFERKIYCPKR
jgi:hypothetical protein